ncbi:MAG: hypothetical protein IJ165_11745 [Proteobacteria bacterium]|nr:hypothetical protein [Pseudomonadota bacterium]
MADLRDYQTSLHALFREFSKLKSSECYQQIRASGADCMRLRIRQGHIADFEMRSDMCVEALRCDKRGNQWRISNGNFPDFGIITDWERASSRMTATTSRTDPRPPLRQANEQAEQLQPPKRYDPEIARVLPAILIHRTYQTLGPILHMGFHADLTAIHLHGGCAWDDAPLPFAWADNNTFCFNPQTAIEESLCIYTPEKPHLRRYISATSYQLTDRTDATAALDDLRTAQNTPLLAFSDNNIDRTFLMPSAVAEILTCLLKSSDAPALPQSLECVDLPTDPLFEHSSIPVPGKPLSHEASGAQIFCPILRGTGSMPDIQMSPNLPAALSQHHSGRIFCIEHLALKRAISGAVSVYLPHGGVLYSDGQFLGHVMIPPRAKPLADMLSSFSPVSAPIRIGRLAACAVETAL